MDTPLEVEEITLNLILVSDIDTLLAFYKIPFLHKFLTQSNILKQLSKKFQVPISNSFESLIAAVKLRDPIARSSLNLSQNEMIKFAIQTEDMELFDILLIDFDKHINNNIISFFDALRKLENPQMVKELTSRFKSPDLYRRLVFFLAKGRHNDLVRYYSKSSDDEVLINILLGSAEGGNVEIFKEYYDPEIITSEEVLEAAAESNSQEIINYILSFDSNLEPAEREHLSAIQGFIREDCKPTEREYISMLHGFTRGGHIKEMQNTFDILIDQLNPEDLIDEDFITNLLKSNCVECLEFIELRTNRKFNPNSVSEIFRKYNLKVTEVVWYILKRDSHWWQTFFVSLLNTGKDCDGMIRIANHFDPKIDRITI